jgi:hypothetical protein
MKNTKMIIMAVMAGLVLTLSATSARAADLSIKFVLGLPIPVVTVAKPAPVVVHHPVVHHRPVHVVSHKAPPAHYRPVPVAARSHQYGYSHYGYYQTNTGYAKRR